jgi:predicted DNA-binding transcriptional regulator AlpA
MGGRQNATDETKLLTVRHVAAQLGMKTAAVHTMISRGQLPCARKLGRKTVFLEHEVRDFLNALPRREPTAK